MQAFRDFRLGLEVQGVLLDPLNLDGLFVDENRVLSLQQDLVVLQPLERLGVLKNKILDFHLILSGTVIPGTARLAISSCYAWFSIDSL